MTLTWLAPSVFPKHADVQHGTDRGTQVVRMTSEQLEVILHGHFAHMGTDILIRVCVRVVCTAQKVTEGCAA